MNLPYVGNEFADVWDFLLSWEANKWEFSLFIKIVIQGIQNNVEITILNGIAI